MGDKDTASWTIPQDNKSLWPNLKVHHHGDSQKHLFKGVARLQFSDIWQPGVGVLAFAGSVIVGAGNIALLFEVEIGQSPTLGIAID